jgi:hypothetical protein
VFTGRFYKTCWNIIKVDLMEALAVLHQGNAQKLWQLNSSYLILIPKKMDASSPGDFRPISLNWSQNCLLIGWALTCMSWLQLIKVLLSEESQFMIILC